MSPKTLLELLNLADQGSLDADDLSLLEQYVNGCSHGLAVRLVVRERCRRVPAPPKLRLRIRQTFTHRQA